MLYLCVCVHDDVKKDLVSNLVFHWYLKTGKSSLICKDFHGLC